MKNTVERIENKTRYTGEYKDLNEDWDEIYKNLTINKWQAGFMLSGILLFFLGVAWFVGNCLAYFIEYLV
jgi:hypothetical protein